MTSVRPKLKADIPKVITAWDVATGATVYQTADRNWSENVADAEVVVGEAADACLLYTSPSPRDVSLSRMPSSA